MRDSTPCHFKPAGYLILQDAEAARDRNSYHQEFGLYCGVDRQFVYPSRDGIDLATSDHFTIDGLEQIVSDFWDKQTNFTAFLADFGTALSFYHQIRTYLERIELVYCDLAITSGEEDRLDAYEETSRPDDRIILMYGFDVSWPWANHSAIIQPGVVPDNPTWKGRLNRWGLLDSFEDALTLRKEYLEVYPYPPFDIYLVHKLNIQDD
ncbi:MAG: hypothetical protein NVSMB9_27730 [Isosphaeraceae bacterium]